HHLRAWDVSGMAVTENGRTRRPEALERSDRALGITLSTHADHAVEGQDSRNHERIGEAAGGQGQAGRRNQHQSRNGYELVLQDLRAGAAVYLRQPIRAVARSPLSSHLGLEAGRTGPQSQECFADRAFGPLSRRVKGWMQ